MTAVGDARIVDPVHDGATDPVLVWNEAEASWWCLFVHRHANTRVSDPTRIGRCHGTQVGAASTGDGGRSWLYRGDLELGVEAGLNTYWGPDVVTVDGRHHLIVTFIRGVPNDPAWDTHGSPSLWHRTIHHLWSDDLWSWTYESRIPLSSDHVVDPFLHRLPNGSWGLWFKDEARGGALWRASSPDLSTWVVDGEVLSAWHEGPVVFWLGGRFWMLAESRDGSACYVSDDAESWSPRSSPFAAGAGSGPARQPYVLAVDRDSAYVFYYTQTGTDSFGDRVPTSGQSSHIEATRITVTGDRLAREPEALVPSLPPPVRLPPSRTPGFDREPVGIEGERP